MRNNEEYNKAYTLLNNTLKKLDELYKQLEDISKDILYISIDVDCANKWIEINEMRKIKKDITDKEN